MLGIATNETFNRFINLIKSDTCYLSLHYDYPSNVDPTATEIISGGYKRQLITWSSSATSLVNSNTLTFTGLTSCTIKYVGVFDALNKGYLLFKIPLDSPIVIINSDNYVINANDLFIAFGSSGQFTSAALSNVYGGAPTSTYDDFQYIDAGNVF